MSLFLLHECLTGPKNWEVGVVGRKAYLKAEGGLFLFLKGREIQETQKLLVQGRLPLLKVLGLCEHVINGWRQASLCNPSDGWPVTGTRPDKRAGY